MITSEEIAIRVYQLLQASTVSSLISGTIDYERADYTKEDVVVIPHTMTGEGSVRYGQINVNVHVPDLQKKTGFKINYPRLIEIRKEVINVLKNHYEIGSGYNWNISSIDPPIKEPKHDEHFVCVKLEITVRNKV